jgi:hypothetical protein
LDTTASINLLEVLEDKEKELLNQLEQLRVAINALKKGGLFKFLWENKHSIVTDSILSKTVETENTPSKEIILSPVAFSYEEKVKRALNDLGKGSVADIYKYWLQKGDETDQNKLFKGITLKASQLFRSGNIKAVRDGKKYIYFPNDKEIKTPSIIDGV